MIEKTVAYKVGEQFFPTIVEAQTSELATLLNEVPISDVPGFLVRHSDQVVDILTMTPTSKPRARRINGGKKTRKASAEAVNAALQDGKQ